MSKVKHQKMVEDLQAMGYSRRNCERALKVSDYDLEQAVGFLCMGEVSQRNLEDSFGELRVNATNVATTTATTGGSVPSKHVPRQGGGSTLVFGGAGVGPSVDESLHRGHLPPNVAVGNVVSESNNDIETLSKEEQLVNMGYDRTHARQALQTAVGDLQQAINFLLMGESKAGFVVESEPPPSSLAVNVDTSTAATLMHTRNGDETAIYASSPVPQLPSSTLKAPPVYATTTTNNVDTASAISNTYYSGSVLSTHPSSDPKPTIVATQTFLTTPGALPFCTCVCASKFLAGGIVSSGFLRGIMESGVELYRKEKAASSSADIDQVLRKYGRSHLRIQAAMHGMEGPRQGVFMEQDLRHHLGLRNLLSLSRNQQGPGWQIIVVELETVGTRNSNGTGNEDDDVVSDSFCICLPPKGTSNKFWFLDFLPRTNVKTTGAYALVHPSLQQLGESLESVFKTLARKNRTDFISFTLYWIKKI